VERAIDLIRHGRYGLCEICEQAIPIERLKALPFTLVCVVCQRMQEKLSHNSGSDDADWESAFELEGRLHDRELTLGDIDISTNPCFAGSPLDGARRRCWWESVVGLGLGSWSWVRPVHARPDDRRPIESAVGDHARSPLIEASRELARVAAEITPSVVHIESKVESPSRGLLEETGSGAIVTSPKVAGYFVVTNRHVVGDASGLEQISVRLSDGRAFHPTRRWIDREPTWPS